MGESNKALQRKWTKCYIFEKYNDFKEIMYIQNLTLNTKLLTLNTLN